MSEDTQSGVFEEIRTGYADAGPQRDNDAYHRRSRCLSFVASEWLPAASLKEAVEYVGPYNAFDPEYVAETLVPRVTDVQPDVRFALGREGSPVIYVETTDAEAIIDAVGPRRYEATGDEYKHNPDELGEADVVGAARKELYGDGDDQIDPHQGCEHTDPPVPVEAYPNQRDNREYVRMWWD